MAQKNTALGGVPLLISQRNYLPLLRDGAGDVAQGEIAMAEKIC